MDFFSSLKEIQSNEIGILAMRYSGEIPQNISLLMNYEIFFKNFTWALCIAAFVSTFVFLSV